MRRVGTIILSVICLALAAMWVYAFVFASKEAVNKIGDQGWTQRANARCQIAEDERIALADYRLIDDPTTGGLAQRAELVDKATDTLQRMLDDLRETLPTDAKGQALIPMWLADYDTYLADRRAYTDQLRRGDNSPFSETTFEGLPLAERIATFAGDNRMPACAPPIDLSV